MRPAQARTTATTPALNSTRCTRKASALTDIDEANSKFQQAQEVLLADLPAIPLWYSNVTGGYGEDVDNVEFGWNSVPIYSEITKG